MRIFDPKNQFGNAILSSADTQKSSVKLEKQMAEGSTITITSADISDIENWELSNASLLIEGQTYNFLPDTSRDAGGNLVIDFGTEFSKATLILKRTDFDAKCDPEKTFIQPVMTSENTWDNEPSFGMTVEGECSGTMYPWKAFDANDSSTGWMPNLNETMVEALVTLDYPVRLKKIRTHVIGLNKTGTLTVYGVKKDGQQVVLCSTDVPIAIPKEKGFYEYTSTLHSDDFFVSILLQSTRVLVYDVKLCGFYRLSEVKS